MEIEVTATNRRETCWLAIQPNACHALPDVSAPLLRLTEERPSQRKSCSILDHNGTMIFTPAADRIRIGSPLSGHYIRLDCPRSQTWGILSQVCGSWFTLEPYGRIRQCRKAETVRLHLKYELA